MAAPDCFIDHLSNEIFLIILSFVRNTSQNSLLQAALVCKRFHGLATEVLLGSLDLIISPRRFEPNLRLFRRLEENHQLCTKIQRVTVSDTISTWNPWQCDEFDNDFMIGLNYRVDLLSVSDEFDDRPHVRGEVLLEGDVLAQVDRFATILPMLTKIRSLRWRAIGLIPLRLYEAVNSKQGSCSLEILTTSIVSEGPATLSFFKNSKCLSSIALSLYSPGPSDEHYNDIQETLRSCRALRRIFLFNYEDHPATYSMFPGQLRIPFRRLDELRIDGYELKSGSEELWGNVIDWSQLRKVALDYSAVMPLLLAVRSVRPQTPSSIQAISNQISTQKFSRLRSLSVSFLRYETIPSEHIKQLMEFVGQACSLEEVRFSAARDGPAPFNLASLLYPWSFAQSLRSLSIIGCGWLLVDHIRLLGKTCPQLRFLGISLIFGVITPTWVLDCVAIDLWFVPRLRFEIEWVESDEVDRFPSHIKISHFWSHIWKQRDKLYHEKGLGCPGSFLKGVDVSGPSLSAAGLRFWRKEVQKSFVLISPKYHREHWHEDYQQYQTRLSERDDEALLGVAVINCRLFSFIQHLMLEHDMNYRNTWDKCGIRYWIEKIETEKVVPQLIQCEFEELECGGTGHPRLRPHYNECICDYFEPILEPWSDNENLNNHNGGQSGHKPSTGIHRPMRQRSILDFFVLTGPDGKAVEDPVGADRNPRLRQCHVLEFFKPLARDDNATPPANGARRTVSSSCLVHSNLSPVV